MGRSIIFKNGFKGVDSGANPASLADGYSPNCLNWMPSKSKAGVHGVRKGSKIYNSFQGNSLRHMHSWITQDGILRQAMIDSTGDLTTGSYTAPSEYTEVELGTLGCAMQDDDSVGMSDAHSHIYWYGNADYEALTGDTSYTADTPYADSTLKISIGDSENPLSSFNYIKFVTTLVTYGPQMNTTNLYVKINTTDYLVNVLECTETSPPNTELYSNTYVSSYSFYENTTSRNAWSGISVESAVSGPWVTVGIFNCNITIYGVTVT